MMARDCILTPLGPIFVKASTNGLTEVGWGEKNPSNEENPHLAAAREWFRAYFSGESQMLPELDSSRLTGFQKRTLDALISQTHFGKVVSYGELAELAGSKGASRAVGSVMAMNPWPLLVPCHRVVRSDRMIGNYSGLGGQATKIRLLEHEGHSFDEAGRLIH